MDTDQQAAFVDRYVEACKRAATDQGLDPIAAALTEAGLPFEIAQTGGFCMVIEIPIGDGWLGITANERTGEGAVVCSFEHEDDEGTIVIDTSSIDDAVAAVAERLHPPMP